MTTATADEPTTAKRESRRGPKPPKDGKSLPSGVTTNGDVRMHLDENPEGELWNIELDSIDIPVATRPINELHVVKLAASISDIGLQSPIIVYHNGDESNPRFILGPGRHRLEAHRRMGLPTIRAFVRKPATMAEIRFAQAIENLHRKDLSPIEEAEMCEVILEASPGSGLSDGDRLEHAAAQIGCSRDWLERRLALNRLSPRVRQLVLEGHVYLSHAEILARLVSHEKQEEITGRLKGGQCKWRRGHVDLPKPLHDWKDAVDKELRTLSDVTWELDSEFGGKPACSTCEHNSANAQSLFDDGAPKKPQCLNAKCFGDKARLAGSAVRRAANTLVKLTAEGELKTTAAGAKKAVEQRDVPFVHPKAVLAAAKKQQQPKKQTKSERAGAASSAASWERRNRITREYWKQIASWKRALLKEIQQHSFDPWAKFVLHWIEDNLARSSYRFDGNDKTARKLQARARKMLEGVVPHGNSISGLAATFAVEANEAEQGSGGKYWFLPGAERSSTQIFPILCEWLKIEIKEPAPNEQAIKAEFDAKGKAKASAKMKTAKKKSKRRTKTKARAAGKVKKK